MRLLRLDIRGFGRLNGRYPLDVGSGQVSLLLEENETGKSTLATAVIATLFGLQSDRRRSRGRLSEQDQYRPWNGGAYAASLQLEHRGQELLIERDFQEASVRVLSGSDDITQEFSAGSRIEVGERLTGLSRSQFALSAHMGQGELVWSDGAELSEALQRVTDTDDGGSTAAAALNALDDTLQNYAGLTLKRGRIETEIKQCRARLDEDRDQLVELEERRSRLGQKIATLAADGARSEWLAHQQRILEARRMLQQSAELGERLKEDEALAAEIERLQKQTAEEGTLRALDTRTVQAVLDAHGEWQAQSKARAERQQAVEERKANWRKLVEARDAMRLARRPSHEDQQGFANLTAEMKQAEAERERLQAEVKREQEEIRSHGFEVHEAERLATQLEKLGPEALERVHGRTQSLVRIEEERRRLDQELAQHKRRRAEIRQGQQLRKHFGIWCFVVGLLPVMVAITMHPHLPFAPWILHAVGGLLGVAGIISLVWGQTAGRGEDERLAPLVGKLRSQLNELAREENDSDRQWQKLAQDLDIAEGELEERCKRFMNVERRVDTLRRLDDRLHEVIQADENHMKELRRLWTVFDDEPDRTRLVERQARVAEGLELYRQLDTAETWMRDEERRAEEAKAGVDRALKRLHETLRAAGVELSGDEQVPELLHRLRDRAERAEAARERFERQLPALRKRRLGERERSAFETQLQNAERKRAERVAQLSADATRGADFALNLNRLDDPLDADAYDAKRNELVQTEREQRQAEENDRLEARSFLADYERDAPVLRERIEETEIAHRRATETRDAITLAREMLSDLAQESHRSYAARLNSRTNELLRAMDSEAQDAHFDEALQLRLQQRGKVLSATDAATQLSAGALDIVYLAARLAVAQTLGASDPLPLVLDDPFANTDDRRLVRGVQLLLDAIAPRQQVIIMACQESRYSWLRSQLKGADRLVTISRVVESKREG